MTQPPKTERAQTTAPPETGLTRFEEIKATALRQDDVEIVHYESQFHGTNSRAERRISRVVTLLFLLCFIAALAFVVIYIWWPWEWEPGSNAGKLYTPLLGFTLGTSLIALAFGVLTWGRKLLPREVAIQQRHDISSPPEERKRTGQSLMFLLDEMGIKRRPVIGLAAVAGLGTLGIATVAPLIGGLIRDPHNDEMFFHTGFDPALNNGEPVRLTREDGTPIRPADVSVGGQMTVFPGIPGGATNEHADSPTLLIHLRSEDGAKTRANAKPVNEGSQWGNYVAYSKICTHAGCPASLYEQQTNLLLCPCHQSQFQITDNARPVFGPASRALPQLPLGLDEEGYFVALSDYKVAIGPAFWERP
jgi:ubiquinol-cytochrome c reductase iron-sulfur subunit